MRERALRALFPAGVDRRGIAVLSTGHLAADLFQGSVPALLPFLIRDRGYSYAAAGTLFLMASLGSSLLQPLLGIFADRVRAGWLMPVGLLVAGVGLAGVGLVESYAGTAALLLAGGFGVAAFHPEAVRFASHVSATRRGAGMSVFAVGGTIGFALGPILMTPVVLTFGLRGTPDRGGGHPRRRARRAREHALPRALPPAGGHGRRAARSGRAQRVAARSDSRPGRRRRERSSASACRRSCRST